MAATKEEFDALVDPIRLRHGRELYAICMTLDFYSRAGNMANAECQQKYAPTLVGLCLEWANWRGIKPEQVYECLSEIQQAITTFAIVDNIPD